jgi:uncharacterized membrane protein
MAARLQPAARYRELDILRGLAVLLMIIFHFFWDLNYFSILKLELYAGLLGLLQVITAGSFLVLAGIGLTLSRRKRPAYKRHFLFRGLKIFGLGMVITLVTYAFLPQGTIFFGILHMIGLSIILSIPLVGLSRPNLALFAALVLLGQVLGQMMFSFPWLLWLGLRYPIYTFDYFPLIPWFGLVCLGIFLGNNFYPGLGERLKTGIRPNAFTRPLGFLGRHSLLVYFLHQPILMGLILLLA